MNAYALLFLLLPAALAAERAAVDVDTAGATARAARAASVTHPGLPHARARRKLAALQEPHPAHAHLIALQLAVEVGHAGDAGTTTAIFTLLRSDVERGGVRAACAAFFATHDVDDARKVQTLYDLVVEYLDSGLVKGYLGPGKPGKGGK